jgi:DGQHR domain-containing protein
MSDFSCTAIRVRQPSTVFYVGVVKATDLVTVCRPLQRSADTGIFARNNSEPVKLSEAQFGSLVNSLESPKFQKRTSELLSEEREQPYQRFLDEKRSVQIARYLEQPSALLPNSIILAVNIDLDEADVVLKKDGDTVEISLPRTPNSAIILDGQHRVAAFNYLPSAILAEFQVVVTFLVGVPFYQQAELFATINGKQKAVNKSIIYDLFGYAPIGGNKEERLYEGLMAVARFCSHVTRILNTVDESPWKKKIKMRGPGDDGVISQAAVAEYMSALVEPKTLSKRLRILPLLFEFFKDSSPAACAAVLILYLRAIQTALPDVWTNANSLLWKNNGVAVVLRIMHDDILLAGGGRELMDRFPALIARWKKAPRQDLEAPPKAGGGGVQNQLYERFRKEMFSDLEIHRLEEMREQLKAKLAKTGGLVS